MYYKKSTILAGVYQGTSDVVSNSLKQLIKALSEISNTDKKRFSMLAQRIPAAIQLPLVDFTNYDQDFIEEIP